jgi:hypothetical protein
MKGLELAERYFEEVGFPMLKREFSPYLDRLAAGLVGDGSECYGFDDAISRDHDWGPGFCLWMTRKDYEEIAGTLQAALETLPKTFEGCGPRRTSTWGDDRVGVFEITDFYRRFLGLDRPPTALDTWLVLPENSLAACTNGKVFRDPLGEFTEWREGLCAFYPEDVRRKKIAARCMTIGQAGQYNFPRCTQRGELFAAQYAETKFCADVISVVFLLNREYTPFYKWMHRAVGTLPVLGAWIRDRIADLIAESDLASKEERIEEICTALIREFGRQMLSEHDSTFLPDHGPVIQAKIQDGPLRGRNVWVG